MAFPCVQVSKMLDFVGCIFGWENEGCSLCTHMFASPFRLSEQLRIYGLHHLVSVFKFEKAISMVFLLSISDYVGVILFHHTPIFPSPDGYKE